MTTNTLLTPADFPVTWRYPQDAQWLWSQDRLHYPDPVTPLEFSLIEGGVDAGLTKAARAYDIPITVHDRHINGYLYVAIEPQALPAAEAAAKEQQSEAKLNVAMANLCANWETAWLPEIQQHLAWWADSIWQRPLCPPCSNIWRKPSSVGSACGRFIFCFLSRRC